MIQTLAVLTFLFFSSLSPAAESFFADFQAGIQAYQKQDYKKAIESFMKALPQSPRNAAVLSNLALAEFQLGQKGLAIAHFRQALSVDPGLPTAQNGLKLVLAQQPVKEIPHRIESYETIRNLFLKPVSLISYLLLTAFILLIAGWILIQYFGKKKRAFVEQTVSPPIPLVGFILSLLFVCSAMLTVMKIWDSTQARATVVENKVAVQSAPGENQAVLFELYEGLEVIVRTKHESWIQISYPGGLSGWVPDKTLMITTL